MERLPLSAQTRSTRRIAFFREELRSIITQFPPTHKGGEPFFAVLLKNDARRRGRNKLLQFLREMSSGNGWARLRLNTEAGAIFQFSGNNEMRRHRSETRDCP